jgi:hypothetical protein
MKPKDRDRGGLRIDDAFVPPSVSPQLRPGAQETVRGLIFTAMVFVVIYALTR